ncbi:MAG: NirD/YgiW/YdeI family stress tolerance protein [Mailhella sp.]|nr:NirD/YgiW/YdeI family stress tolerance protein [Mailhella sp.]
MRLVIASALTLLLVSPASAALVTVAQFGGFKGPNTVVEVDTVAKALKAGDEAPCVLEGKIISAGPKRDGYVFQDATGKITVELDGKLFQGRTVTPENVIRIYGEVETKHSRDSEVDVEWFEIIK